MENNNIDEDTLKKLNNMTPDELKKIQAIIKEAVNEIEATKEGKWIKYEQGSNSHELWLSLQEYHTGWGIAKNENIARDQLANGDFYVYYSLDENEDAKVPRIAIAMNGTKEITEIRGIADDQNIEPEMLPILNKKLNEDDKFDKQKIDIYLKRVHDMELLTLIDKKTSYGEELSVDETRFLYEADSKIIGFGQRKDPRINEIKKKRNEVKDYTLMFKYNKNFSGNLNLTSLTSVKNLDLSGVNIDGYLNLEDLTTAEGLDLSGVNIGVDLSLSGLTSVKDLNLSGANIRRDLKLESLTSVKNLNLSGANIGENLYLSSLTSVENLDLSGADIGKYLNLSGLTSVKNLDLSGANINNLNLSGLTSAKDLNLSEAYICILNLSGLTSAEGLDLSGVNIGGYLDLSGLTTAKGLELPKNIDYNLILNGLTSTEGLKLPKNIGGDLSLSGLTSTEGLKLPKNIGGDLSLSGLTNAEGLDLSGVNIGRRLDLSGLTSAEGLNLSGANIGFYPTPTDSIDDLLYRGLDLSGLTSAKGLNLFEANINGDLNLRGLTDAEGLNLSGVNIGGYLNLSGLTNVEGLMLPYDFELDNLICNDDIKEEIRNNHDKYFAKPPVEEELNEAAAQKFNDETEALIINGNGDKKVAYVKKYDGTIEKIPYSKNMDKFIGEQKAAKERGKFSRFFEISSDPEVARGQVEALEEIINRNNNLDSADNSKQSDGNVADESMNVHRTR